MARKPSSLIYYGTTKTGKRLHLGDEVLFPDGREWVVIAHCGAAMVTRDKDEPSPARVTEFCRNCFRTQAWAVFESELLKRSLENANRK